MFIPEIEYKLILQKIPILCVDLLIISEKKCLLLKRDNEPVKGQYWFPGGRVNKLESIENASIRKAKEETNLECDFIKILTIEETVFKKNENMLTDIHTVNICCLMTPIDISLLKIDKFHNNYKWVDKPDVNLHKSVNNPLSLCFK